MSKCLGIILYPPPISLWKYLVYKDYACLGFGDLNLCPQLVQQVLVLTELSFHQLAIHNLLKCTLLLALWAGPFRLRPALAKASAVPTHLMSSGHQHQLWL